MCNTLGLLGIDCDGGFAQYVQVPVDSIVPLPENISYKLGAFVEPAAVAEAVKKHAAPLVGLSALMTTTLGSMEQTIRLLREEHVPCKVVVGGAVLTPDYARQIGADFYAKDAKESVDVARQVIG